MFKSTSVYIKSKYTRRVCIQRGRFIAKKKQNDMLYVIGAANIPQKPCPHLAKKV